MFSFNPRARVGRDAYRLFLWLKAQSFNPRARVGRDLDSISAFRWLKAFQSTRPRGARHCAASRLFPA